MVAVLVNLASAAEDPTPAPPSPSDVVVMEKILVEATEIHTTGVFGVHDRWIYVELPDCEVLSLTSTEVTLGASRHLANSLDLERRFVPARYLSPGVVPDTFVMFDHPNSRAMDALVPVSMEVSDSTADYGKVGRNTMSIGGIDTSDYDTHCVVQNRWGNNFPWAGDGSGHGPIPAGLLFELSRCVPALPLWYQYGFVGPCGMLSVRSVSDGVALPHASWIDQETTDSILKRWTKQRRLPEFPPLQVLFNKRAPERRDASIIWPSPEWMAEAALFLRWGLYGANEPMKTGETYTDPVKHRTAFEAFVERSRTEKVTETMFRECFGFGYAEAQAQIQHYFVYAARQEVIVPYSMFPDWSPEPNKSKYNELTVRLATDEEIARILGDWERMQAFSLKTTKPDISDLFLRRAGKTLHKAYEAGDDDPSFLAVLGLYDVDVGLKEEARKLLTQATEAHVRRCSAYVSLAQLNLDAAIALFKPGDDRLSPAELASVLRPLFVARKIDKLASEGYQIIAQAWSLSSAAPKRQNLAVLDEGLSLYPFDLNLHLAAARCYANWKYLSEANSVIEHGLAVAEDNSKKELVDFKNSMAVGRVEEAISTRR